MIVCLLIGIWGITSNVFDAYSQISDSMTRLNAGTYSEDVGFRWAYLLEAAFFYYYIRKYYDVLGNDTSSLVGLNLSIAFCCILWLLALEVLYSQLVWEVTMIL